MNAFVATFPNYSVQCLDLCWESGCELHYASACAALLFTQERGTSGGVMQLTTGFPAEVKTLDGIVGKGGYEGIHPDNIGNLLIIEDSGGTSVGVDPANPSSPKNARNPNSFVYRFVPYDPTNLFVGGRLEALQVSIDDTPLTFVAVDASHPNGDVFSDAQLKLHTLGT